MSKTQNTNKTEATTALSLNFNAADSMKAVQAELAKLTKIAERVYNTQDKTIVMGSGESISIQNCTDIAQLIKLGASVRARQAAYDGFNSELVSKGLIKEAPLYTEVGVSADGIIEDICLRITVLDTEGRRKELTDIANDFKELISREEKIQLANERLMKFVGVQS